MTKAVIFDLDGVIIDTAHYHYIAWKRLASEFGVTLTPAHNELLKGVSRMRSLEIILSLGNIELPIEQRKQLADKKNNWFVEYIESVDLIKDLRAKNIKVGLASSSKNAPRVIELLGIAPLFDTLIDGTMIVHTKPDPEIFLLAAHKLEIKPSDCLVFEDAEAGVEAALAAGMKCVGVGSKDQLGKANLIVKSTGDFNIETLNSL